MDYIDFNQKEKVKDRTICYPSVEIPSYDETPEENGALGSVTSYAKNAADSFPKDLGWYARKANEYGRYVPKVMGLDYKSEHNLGANGIMDSDIDPKEFYERNFKPDMGGDLRGGVLKINEKVHDIKNGMLRGAIDIIKDASALQRFGNAFEEFMDKKELREAAFPLKSTAHFVAGMDIGAGIEENALNLSSNINRFAKSYNEYRTDKIDGGNSIRHALWQAALTSKYGADVARDAGNSHETRPYADLGKRVFDNEAEADMVTDLLNNKIGRQIGIRYPKRGTKDCALLVLKEFWEHGLYCVVKVSGECWYVERRKLPDQLFYKLFNLYLQKDEYGN